MSPILVTLAIFAIFAAVKKGLWPFVGDTKPRVIVSHSDDIESFASSTARMEQRIDTIERIMTADNPNWRL